MYKIASHGVIRLSDDAYIPDDPTNRDWRKYQQWLKAGNKPQPADPEPEPTTDELLRKAGVTTEAMVKALWQRVIHKQSEKVSGVEALKTIEAQIIEATK